MADITALRLKMRVRYRDREGKESDGTVVGIRRQGVTEGEIDPDGPFVSGEVPDRIKVVFPVVGVPPEFVSVSCSPDAVEVL